MNQPLSPAVADSARWHATLDLDLQRRRAATRLIGCRHEGPLYVQKPFYPEGPDCAHVYLLHPPGGMVSGDCLEIGVNLGEGAAALLTTPGAARAYRARDNGTLQRQHTRLQLAAGASVEWFPLETIVYNGASVEMETEVQLSADASCALWEVTCLGLPASDEPFTRGSFRQRYRVLRDGVPVFVDGFALEESNRQRMAGMGALQEQPVNGFFLMGPFTTDADDEQIEALRAAIPQALERRFSITRLGEYYVGRYLGGNAEQARAQFARWWQMLRPALLGRPASPPRIWLT